MINLTFSCNKCEKDCSITDLKILLCGECFDTQSRCNDCKAEGTTDICCKCKKLNKKYGDKK